MGNQNPPIKTTSRHAKRPCEVITKDKEEAITLMALGYNFTDVIPVETESGKKISLFVFPIEAFEAWKNFIWTNDPIMVDIRKVWIEHARFYQFVYKDD